MIDSENSNSFETNEDDREVLTRIYKNVNRYYRFQQNNINRLRTNRKFLFYDQWSRDERESFAQLNKPIFTYNKLYDYYRKLIGEQRFNTTNLEVSSVNGIGNQHELTLRADIIRGIESRSRADIAYQTAFADAVSGGLGFIKLKTDYLSPNTFKQEIFIVEEKYPERVGYDPFSITATKTDGNFMFRYEFMEREIFEELHPDIPYPQSFPINYNTIFFNWGDKSGLVIMEYYEKQYYDFKLYLLDNGQEVSEEEYKEMKDNFEGKNQESPSEGLSESPSEEITSGIETAEQFELQDIIAQEQAQMEQEAPSAQPLTAGEDIFPQIVDERTSRSYKIMCYKCIAGRIIEEYEWPSKHFPFAAVVGDEVIIDGESMFTSLVTYAMDPQRFLNFLASDCAQAAKNNRREQFLVTPSNIEGFETFWKNPANQAGALPYNPDDQTKQAPIQLRIPELPQTLILNMQQADKDLRSIIGYPQEMNDGRTFGQLSGKAIREMQRIGNSSNMVFFSNLERAQEQIGRAILSMLPKIYDTERTLTGIGIDGKSKKITVNRQVAGKIVNDLSTGDYDVQVKAGANYAVQKEDALNVLIELTRALPGSGMLIADIVAKNIDIEDNIELVNRLKTLVPPDVLAKAEGRPVPPQQPNPQQQQQQMEQQLAQAKLQIEAAKVQTAQQQAQAQQQLNQVKLNQAAVDMQSSKIRAYGEMQKAGLDYKAQMVQAAAKVAAAHADISDKHFEAMKHIHNLEEAPLVKKAEQEAETT